MTTNDNDNELVNDAPMLWEADGTLKKDAVRTLADLNKQYEIVLPHFKAAELVDQTFTIQAAKKIASEYKGQTHYYFCVCRGKDGKEFTASFGGGQVMQIIDRLIELKIPNAVEVTLKWTPTKNDEGFYTIE